MALTTLEQFKAYMGIGPDESDATQDAQIAAIIPGVDRAIKNDIRRRIERGTVTQYLNGNNQESLRLRETPVVPDDMQVFVDSTGYSGQGPNAFGAETELTQGTDYYLPVDQEDGTSLSGLLVRIGCVWPGRIVRSGNRLVAERVDGQRNIKVVYTGGYLTVPEDLVMLANQLVGWVAKRLDGQQIQSERIDEYSYTMAGSKEAQNSIVGASDTIKRYRGGKWVVA